MKKIIDHDKEIFLPNCMYSVKYRTDLFQEDYSDSDIGISAQVIKFLKVFVTKIIKLTLL